MPTTAEEVNDDLLVHVRTDPELFARLMETVFGANAAWACPTEELLVDDEARTVEYKQTARWNVREQRRDRTMEQVVVKTVAGLLNDRGGTLLIGVTDGREPVGLDDDNVKPPNADGYVNWLDTLFENNLGHADANRLDIPASSRPIWVKTKTGSDTLYQRRNNSTRQVPADEIKAFITERFGQQEPGAPSRSAPTSGSDGVVFDAHVSNIG